MAMRLSTVLALAMIVLLSAVGADRVPPVRAAPAAAMLDYFVTPIHSFIAVAERCTLYVEAGDTGEPLGCIETWVTFDTSLVTLFGASEGELFVNAPYPKLFFWQSIAPDTQSVEGCLLGPGSFALPPGRLARFIFEGKAEGTCHARITRLNLWDIDRVMFAPHAIVDAWIHISNSPPTGIRPSAGDAFLRAQPNPFNPSTTLVLSVAATQAGSVAVYRSDGRLVRRLFAGRFDAGINRFVWDGRDNNGQRVPSGVYFGVARGAAVEHTTKMVLLQ